MKNNRKIVIFLIIFVFSMASYLGIKTLVTNHNVSTQIKTSADLGFVLEDVPEEAKVNSITPPQEETSSPKASKAPKSEKAVMTIAPTSTSQVKNELKGSKKTPPPKATQKESRTVKQTPEAITTEETGTPQETSVPKEVYTCSLTVQCKTVLSRMDKLNEGVRSRIPQDGVMLTISNVTLEEGDTIYTVLIRECKKEGLHFDVDVAFTGYVKGLGNLYEKACGSSSGWLYRLNGKFLNIGIKGCKVNNGDQIDFIYTCEKGDVNNG